MAIFRLSARILFFFSDCSAESEIKPRLLGVALLSVFLSSPSMKYIFNVFWVHECKSPFLLYAFLPDDEEISRISMARRYDRCETRVFGKSIGHETPNFHPRSITGYPIKVIPSHPKLIETKYSLGCFVPINISHVSSISRYAADANSIC